MEVNAVSQLRPSGTGDEASHFTRKVPAVLVSGKAHIRTSKRHPDFLDFPDEFISILPHRFEKMSFYSARGVHRRVGKNAIRSLSFSCFPCFFI